MIHVIYHHSLAPEQAKRRDVLHGLTVAQIVAGVYPLEATRERVSVTLINGSTAAPIPSCVWGRVIPHDGTTVRLVLTPGDPVSAFLTSTIAGAVGATAGTLGYAAISLGVSLATTALVGWAINSLVPQPQEIDAAPASDVYSLSSWNNSASLNNAFPLVMGRMRMAPNFVVPPYYEVIDGEMFMRACFTWGNGPLDISDIWIGDTPIDDYEGVEYETREGLDADERVTITPYVVMPDDAAGSSDELPAPDYYDDLGQEVETLTYHPVIRTTKRATDMITLIFCAPGGLINFNSQSDHSEGAATVDIEIRAYADKDDDNAWQFLRTETFEGLDTSALYFERRIRPSSTGKWQIRMTATKVEDASDKGRTKMAIYAVQSVRYRYPISAPTPMALISVRAKASSALNGTIAKLSAVVQRRCLCWNGSTWAEGLTENPAGALLAMAQGPWRRDPVEDDLILWDELQAFWEYCDEHSLTYNSIWTGGQTVRERYIEICGAGRASPRRDGGKLGVILDSADDEINPVCDHINAVNSWSFSGSRTPIDPPDAIRIAFNDATDDYEAAEHIIEWPGHTGDIDTLEEWEMPGKVYPDEVATECYRRMQEAILRRDTWEVMQQFQARTASRGDRVTLSHFVLSGEQVSTRVVRASGNRVTLAEPVEMTDGTTYVLAWQQFSEADTVGAAMLSPVTGAGGNAQVVTVSGDVPPVGTFCTFGPADLVTEPALVLEVAPGDEGSMRLTLTNDAAAELDALVAAYTPPDWDGVPGDESDEPEAPDTPIIREIDYYPDESTGELIYGSGGQFAYDYLFSVTVGMANVSTATIYEFEIDHRLSGATEWSTTSLTGSGGAVFIDGYDTGDVVELRARAVPYYGDASAYTDTVTYTLGSGLVAAPAALNDDDVTVAGGNGRATISAATSDATAYALTIYRTATGNTLDTSDDAIASYTDISAGTEITHIDGAAERVTLVSVSDMTAGAGWAISGDSATHTAGAAGSLTFALSAPSGRVYRVGVVVSGRTAGTVTPRLTGGTTVTGTAISENGQALDTITATGNTSFGLLASADFDGTVSGLVIYGQGAATAPQGVWDYYLAVTSVDGLSVGPSGPLTATII
ncbi:hypothetical protein Q4543_17565 [Salipiger sp. 1_MG-2023]|uniref:TipJ family phage tail tip protein n=1 Tax=Salipiger sp. 1_MG-2023 TaxID=3062665 RepID=UPI0026E2BDBA|nr:hypothetical protein [Salipiger sp. 1_MG-2023]MDO6587323.1 hypothetical protein [Salipiger sp. 1_MG-2023]